MQITRQANYATRAILYLSQFEVGESVSTGRVAREERIPPAFLSKIIARLSHAGITQASRGRYGGVKLARQPRDISMLEVIEAIDGPIELNECVGANNNCPFTDTCPMQPVWCEVQERLVTRLKNTTFAQFVP